jgi:hypothetical protein
MIRRPAFFASVFVLKLAFNLHSDGRIESCFIDTGSYGNSNSESPKLPFTAGFAASTGPTLGASNSSLTLHSPRNLTLSVHVQSHSCNGAHAISGGQGGRIQVPRYTLPHIQPAWMRTLGISAVIPAERYCDYDYHALDRRSEKLDEVLPGRACCPSASGCITRVSS